MLNLLKMRGFEKTVDFGYLGRLTSAPPIVNVTSRRERYGTDSRRTTAEAKGSSEGTP